MSARMHAARRMREEKALLEKGKKVPERPCYKYPPGTNVDDLVNPDDVRTAAQVTDDALRDGDEHVGQQSAPVSPIVEAEGPAGSEICPPPPMATITKNPSEGSHKKRKAVALRGRGWPSKRNILRGNKLESPRKIYPGPHAPRRALILQRVRVNMFPVRPEASWPRPKMHAGNTSLGLEMIQTKLS